MTSPAAVDGKSRRLNAVLAPALLWVSSLIILPVFIIGLPCSHDAFIHLSRAAEVFFNARGGSPFLAWSPDLMRGYGHPILAFYAPAVYWMLAAPRWLGISFADSFRTLAYLALPAGAIGMYWFGRRYLSAPAAFVAGLTYLFAPYLLFDAIQRGALPEAVALGVLPYCLAAIGAAAHHRTARYIALAALLLAGLISLHNLVPLFAVPLGFLVAATEGLGSDQAQAWRWRLGQAWQGLRAGAISIGLAALVTIAVWLPAIVEERQTLTGQPTPPASADLSNWPQYGNNLIPAAELVRWPSEPGDSQLYNAPITRTLGVVPALLSALTILALFHPAVFRRYPLFAAMGVAAAGSLFLSSQPSRWLWDHSTTLQTVQLPTRFLGPANVGVALLCGLFVDLLLARLDHPAARSAAIALPAVAIAVCGWPWLFPRYCTPPAMATPAGIAQPQPPNDWMYDPLGELLPEWVQVLPPKDLLTAQYQAGQPVNRLAWTAGQVVQTAWQTRPGYDRYVLQAAQPATLTYQTFYFPGWQATLDGQPIPLGISSPDGLIQLDLPAGSHVLEIAFHNTVLRTVSWFISGAGLALCLLILFSGRRLPGSASTPPAPPGERHTAILLASTTAGLLLLFFVVLPRFNTSVLGQRLQGERLTGVQHAASISFEQEVRYLGYDAPAQVRADQTFELVQYWKAEHPLGVPYAFAARLADDQGHSWDLPSDRPFDYADYQGSEGWPPDAYIRDAFLMRLLPGTPPGHYWLEVNVFRQTDSLQLVPEPGTATGPDPAWARVGQIEVLPPTSPAMPDDAAVNVVRPSPMAAGLVLAGWSLPSGQINAGDVAHVTLLWQANLHQAPLNLDAQLIEANGQVLADTAVSPGGAAFPITQWPSAALVRDQLDWRVPNTAPGGRYQVVLRSSQASADLGQLQVAAPGHLFDRPLASTAFDQRIGFARLAGYTLSSTSLRPGDSLTVELVWQSMAGTTDADRVFVHLRGPDGLPITQSDSGPAEWQRPTTGWVPGEYIVDRHSLTLPPNAPSQTYDLVVGLYNPASGARLGEVSLGSVTVP